MSWDREEWTNSNVTFHEWNTAQAIKSQVIRFSNWLDAIEGQKDTFCPNNSKQKIVSK